MGAKPAIHGKDHMPGGADPIPSLTTAWCRVRMWNNASDQSVPDTTETPMHFNDSQYYDPGSIFTPTAVDAVSYGITVNVDGLYLIRARMSWIAGSPPSRATISLDGIDPDHFAPYNDDMDCSDLVGGSIATWARLGATQKVAVSIIQKTGSA